MDAHVVDEPALTAWDVFVLRHTKPANLWIHVVSFVMFWGGLVGALALWSPVPLVVFALSGAVGGFGHVVTRDSGISLREATSSPRTVLFASIVVVLYVLGRYAPHVTRARAKLPHTHA